jgi:hypothetical protein
MIVVRKNLFAVALGVGVAALSIGGIVPAAPASDDSTSIVVVQSGSTPSAPQYQVVTPTPGTGSVVVVTPPPSSGSGPSIPQYHLVMPGPNPSQNTGVGLGDQLSTPGNPVTVIPVPGP